MWTGEYNAYDRNKVEFIKFNSLWLLERPGIILEVRCMGSPCSHTEKSVPSHWRLRFASQTSRKWSVFESHHFSGRKMNCIQKRQTQEVMEQTDSNQVMLSVWWDFKGIVFWAFTERLFLLLLSAGQTKWCTSTEKARTNQQERCSIRPRTR